MSKTFRSILPVYAALMLVLGAPSLVSAQDIVVVLRLEPERSVIHVEGEYLKAATPSQPLAFLSDYAGIGLANDRISNMKQSGTKWSYDVKVAGQKGSPARVSWLTERGGILKLDELLPQFGTKDVGVSLDVPITWRSSWFPQSVNSFSKTVILVGPSLLYGRNR